MTKKKFIIIDANSLIHRAFHALPPLTTKDGQLVNAVYGFTTILLKTLRDFKPDYIACCFDVDKDTFRKKEYEAYKAQRAKQPSELYEQIELVKQLLEAFRIPIYEKKGYEADDIIGTLTRAAQTYANKSADLRELKNVVVSGDLDILQLVDNNTEVYTLKRGISETVVYDEKAVKERFGFGPEKLADYKALRGDPSDNIPGVKGIGEKTAIALIQEFGSIEKIYEEIKKYARLKNEQENKKIKAKNILKESVIKKLEENKEQAFLSKKLATIVRDVKIDFDLKDCQVQPFDTQQVVKLFQAWNFTSLISKIPQVEKVMYERQGTLFEQITRSKGQETESKEQEIRLKKGYYLVNNEKTFNKFLKKLKKQEEFAFDTETDGLNPFKDNLIGMSFSWQKGEAYYVPIQQTTSSKQQATNKTNKKPLVTGYGLLVTNKLKPILENEKIKKIGHNIKFDLEVLDKIGIKLQGLAFDTMIASYLLNPGTRQHNLDALAFTELGYKMQSITDLAGTSKKNQINLSQVDTTKVANYACEDADITWQLYHKLSEKLDDVLIEGVLEKIEMPLIPVLAGMEKTGIKLDVKFLNKMSRELELKIKDLESKIFKIAKTKFNVASPLQLKEVLFNKLKISSAGLGKTKTGVSTAAGELEKLKGRHKIIDLIIEHRELSKLKNTYLDPLPKLVDENSRVHTSFNQTVTATGRLSSSGPNLQNIPIRTQLGKKIRQAFIAEKGCEILSADYSQIELRIVASLANDEKMLAAFRKGEDIHRRTAAEIFEVPPEKVTEEMRRHAKAVNFGIIYGLGPHGLSQGTGISYEEACDFINKYFDIHSGIKEYIENTIALTREMGYVETLFGRRRYLPEINAQHQQLRSQAERMAINHPVQGSSADLIKLAMINLDKKIKKEFAKDEVKMLLQVHDELVFEIKKDLIPHAKKIIEREMTSVYKLKAPIEVEIGIGKNWGECK